MGHGLQHQVARLQLPADDLGRLRAALDDLLRPVLHYRVAAISTVDPSTLLLTSCFLTRAEYDKDRERELFDLEFGTEDVNQYAALAGAPVPAAGLALTTGGDASRSLRGRAFLPKHGLGDELRAVFRSRDTVWGTLTAYRLPGEPAFTRRDVDAVASVGPDAADLLRLAMLHAAVAAPGQLDDPPGMLLLSARGEVVASTGEAQRWLGLLGPAGRLPAAVTAVAASARATGRATRASVPAPGRGWLVFHASPAGHEGAAGDGAVSVIVEAARPLRLSDVVRAAYGLTPRERDIVSAVARGRATAQIARELAISPYTVQDHLKAIFDKTGARNRGEMVAALYAQQYEPRNAAGAAPGPYGWFLDDAVAT